MRWLDRAWLRNLLLLALAILAGLPLAARAPRNAASPIPSSDRRISTEHSGTVPVAGTHHLSVTADTGSVHIFTDASGDVRYLVRVEAAAADPDANKLLKQFFLSAQRTPRGVEITGRMPSRDALDRVWVSYEVHMPRRYDLEVSTQAGDIETQDVDGRVALSTGGGTIRAVRIGLAAGAHSPEGARDPFVARLETGGGHIFVGDVAGSLRASTAGGHIVAANVAGDAVLHTDGGHV